MVRDLLMQMPMRLWTRILFFVPFDTDDGAAESVESYSPCLPRPPNFLQIT